MSDTATVLFSAAIGATAALLAAYWRTRYAAKAQDFSKRIEELCEAIEKLEDLSCKYWNSEGTTAKDDISEAYIVGYKSKISILLNFLESEYGNFYNAAISYKAIEFYAACTGGDFESANRKKDSARQRNILITGEQLKIELLRTRVHQY